MNVQPEDLKMAHKQGDQLAFNAVGAGRTMSPESGVLEALAKPGGNEIMGGLATGGSMADFGNVKPGAEHMIMTGPDSDMGMFPRPGGPEKITPQGS